MTLFEYLKNIFLILIFLQLAPSLLEGIRKQYFSYLEPKTKVGVLTITGILYDSSSYTRQLYHYFKKPEIKAILIKMNCLGSAAGTGQAIFNEIQMLKKEFPKPVVVLIENVCASGGYLIACSADRIISPPSAIIGSIGNYFRSIQLREFCEQFKVKYTTVKAGTFKTIGDPFSDLTEEEKVLLQIIQNDAYRHFTQQVANARKLSLTNVKDWADGKIFTGLQAKKLGLIDEIGSAQNAIKALRKLALIEEKEEIEWVKPLRKSSLLSLVTGTEIQNYDSLFTNALNNLCSFLETRYASLKT